MDETLNADLYRKHPDLITRKIGGETIIVPIKKAVVNLGSIYTMNKVGSRIWSLLDERLTIVEIIQKITGEFRVSTEEATRDVSEFLQHLKDRGLIVYEGAGNSPQ